MYYNSLFLLIQKLSYVLALGVSDGIHIIVRGLHLKKKKKKDEQNWEPTHLIWLFTLC